MLKFEMPNDNTCAATGTPIAKGDPVYANNFDEVRNGAGICQAEYDRLFPTEPQSETLPEPPEPPTRRGRPRND